MRNQQINTKDMQVIQKDRSLTYPQSIRSLHDRWQKLIDVANAERRIDEYMAETTEEAFWELEGKWNDSKSAWSQWTQRREDYKRRTAKLFEMAGRVAVAHNQQASDYNLIAIDGLKAPLIHTITTTPRDQ